MLSVFSLGAVIIINYMKTIHKVLYEPDHEVARRLVYLAMRNPYVTVNEDLINDYNGKRPLGKRSRELRSLRFLNGTLVKTRAGKPKIDTMRTKPFWLARIIDRYGH